MSDLAPQEGIDANADRAGRSPYDAYLFDLDGVILDTRDWIREAYRHTAVRYGFEVSDEALDELYGRPLRTCYQALYRGAGPEELMECHRAFQRESVDLQRLFPGARETLVELREWGARIALVSSRTGASLRGSLERFGLTTLLDRIVWPEECADHKPHPEPVLRALRDLDAAPSRALVIGDTPNDILAGRAAGTDTAGATYGFIGRSVARACPTHLIGDPRDILGLKPAWAGG